MTSRERVRLALDITTGADGADEQIRACAKLGIRFVEPRGVAG